MEALRLNTQLSLSQAPTTPAMEVVVSNPQRKAFIEGGTVAASLEDIQQRHIIPVFHRDNEPVISQVEFIQLTQEVVHQCFPSERILSPAIRLSHPVMGRVPEAKDKPAKELLEWEKTIYYERMAFVIEIASITDTIDGGPLSLVVGGIKAHHLDNLYGKRGGEEHFKIFIGFQVSVCTNLCVWSDGLASDVKVKSRGQLKAALQELIGSYDAVSSLYAMSELPHYHLSESQFAHLMGRCRMYGFLSPTQKKALPSLPFGDSQLTAVCRDYYRDNNFCRGEDGTINLWRLYNLFTAANKSSYIDAFVDRSLAATELVSSLAGALRSREHHWFIS